MAVKGFSTFLRVCKVVFLCDTFGLTIGLSRMNLCSKVEGSEGLG